MSDSLCCPAVDIVSFLFFFNKLPGLNQIRVLLTGMVCSTVQQSVLVGSWFTCVMGAWNNS